MRILVESFVNVVFLFVIIEKGISFIRSAMLTHKLTKYQRFLQMFYLVTLLFLISHQIKLLKTVYIEKMWDLDSKSINSKLKSLQYIGENFLNSLVIFTLASFMNSFKNFRISQLKDREMFKISALLYSLMRIFPALYLIFYIFADISFYSFMMEIFLIAESVMLVLIFTNLKVTLNKLKEEFEVCLLPDKSYIEYLLSEYKTFSSKFILSMTLQAVYRIAYLSIILNQRTQILSVVKDISNLLKIISTYLICENINEIIIFNDPRFTVKCEESEKDKFFSYDDTEINLN